MRKFFLLLFAIVGMVSTSAQEYYPEGTKWTEIRLDTLKYDTWYSKVGDEWIPNYEMVEYIVKGEIKNTFWEGGFPDHFKCIYSYGKTWSDSLTLIVIESIYGIQATVPYTEEGILLMPGTAYIFAEWKTSQTLDFQTINGANKPSIPPVGKGSYGIIQEIKEDYFGGTQSLKYANLSNGCQVIQGIGITVWNGEMCLFGAITDVCDSLHYRSMLVHFERNGEVLYDVWPQPGNEYSIKTIRFPPSSSLSRGTIYDLQGRRLEKAPEKGMYLQDGKKVVIK